MSVPTATGGAVTVAELMEAAGDVQLVKVDRWVCVCVEWGGINWMGQYEADGGQTACGCGSC